MNDTSADRIEGLRLAIRESIDDLKTTTRDGFSQLLSELKMSREQGHIPVSVLEKILDSQNRSFEGAHKLTAESNARVLNTLCYVVGGLLAWFTGMKVFFPDSPAPGTMLNPAKIITEIHEVESGQPKKNVPN